MEPQLFPVVSYSIVPFETLPMSQFHFGQVSPFTLSDLYHASYKPDSSRGIQYFSTKHTSTLHSL